MMEDTMDKDAREQYESFVWDILSRLLQAYGSAIMEVIVAAGVRLTGSPLDQPENSPEQQCEDGTGGEGEAEEDCAEFFDCTSDWNCHTRHVSESPVYVESPSADEASSLTTIIRGIGEEDTASESDTLSEVWSSDSSPVQHPDGSAWDELMEGLQDENVFDAFPRSSCSPSSRPPSSSTEDSAPRRPFRALRRRLTPSNPGFSVAASPSLPIIAVPTVDRIPDDDSTIARRVVQTVTARLTDTIDVENLVPQNRTALEVIRETCPDFPEDFRHIQEDMKAAIRAALCRWVVRSSFNHCFYAVVDVDFDQSPLSTPAFARRGRTYKAWLLEEKNVTVPIEDNQPILKAVPIINQLVKRAGDPACLLPQLCLLYGMRLPELVVFPKPAAPSNVELNRAPTGNFWQRQRTISNASTSTQESSIGIRGLTSLPFSSTVTFQQQDTVTTVDADELDEDGNFSTETSDALATTSHRPAHLKDSEWLLLYFPDVDEVLEDFVKALRREAEKRGCNFGEPSLFRMTDLDLDTFKHSLKQQLRQNRTIKLVVFVNPVDEDNKSRYAALKDHAQRVIAVATQAFLDVNILDIEKQRKIVVPHVLNQIIAKLGGIPRVVMMKEFGAHTVAVGVFRMSRPNTKHQIVTACSTEDKKFSEYYHNSLVVENDREVTEAVCTLIKEAAEQYALKNNGTFPQNLIFFRGGVTHGQEAAIRTFEVPAVVRALEVLGHGTTLTYVVEYGLRPFKDIKSAIDDRAEYSLIVYEDSGEQCFCVITKKAFNGEKQKAPLFRLIVDESGLGVELLAEFAFKNSFMYFNKNGKHVNTALVGNARKNARQTATVYAPGSYVSDEVLKHTDYYL